VLRTANSYFSNINNHSDNEVKNHFAANGSIHINTVFGQNTFKAVIKDSETKEPLIGATAILSGTTTGATADIDGLITLTNIPNGKQIIEFRYIGYETRKDTLNFL
jgi:iron complex outermembrane receptor protein